MIKFRRWLGWVVAVVLALAPFLPVTAFASVDTFVTDTGWQADSRAYMTDGDTTTATEYTGSGAVTFALDGSGNPVQLYLSDAINATGNFQVVFLNGSGGTVSTVPIAYTSTDTLYSVNVPAGATEFTLENASGTTDSFLVFEVYQGTDTVPSAAAVPTGLTATAGVGQVALSWTAGSGDSTFNVYQGGTKIASGLTSPSYTVTGLTAGTQYSFTVSAVDSSGVESAQTAPVTASPTAVQVPATPTGLTASAGDGYVSLSWSTVSGATSYNVYQGGTQIQTGVTSPSYTVTGLTDGTQYSFSVTAVDSSGESAQSSAVTATPTASPVPVSGLSVVSGGTTAQASWTGSEAPFTVTWSQGGAQVGSASVTQDVYGISGLSTSTQYSITVTDSGGNSSTATFTTTNDSLVPAAMPDASGVFQRLVDMFGTAGTYAVAVIGGAVALGIIVIVAVYAWRLLKKWLHMSK